MPKTHIKKRIKMQNTRKNNIRGGMFRPALATGTKLMAMADAKDEEPFTTEFKLTDIYDVFKVKQDIGIPIPNYSKYIHFKVTPKEIFIDIKNSTDLRIRCVHGIHKISEIIVHGDEFILIENDVLGKSAIFKSNQFTFKYKK